MAQLLGDLLEREVEVGAEIVEHFEASPVIQPAETSLVFCHLRGTNVLPKV